MKKKLILIPILILALLTSMIATTLVVAEEESLEYVTSVEKYGVRGSHDVAVKDNIAYACGHFDDALYIIDIANPQRPVLLKTFTDREGRLDGIHDIIIDGNIAYVTSVYRNSIVAIDISDISSPIIIGELVDSVKLSGVHALTRRDNYIYTGAWFSNYFNIIDISIPSRPIFVGSISDVRLDGSRGVALQGDFAFVSNRNTSKLVVVDISKPSFPSIISDILLTSVGGPKLQNIYIISDFAYVTCYADSKVFVVDISNPYIPLPETEIEIPYPNYILFSGDYGFVSSATNPGGVTVINVSNPANPWVVASIFHSDLAFASGMAIVGDYILCAPRNTRGKILTVLRLSGQTTAPEINLFIGDLYLGNSLEQDKEDFLEALQSVGYIVIKADNQPNGYEIYK